MTKIGEGGMYPQPSEEVSRKNLQNNILHFEVALRDYPVTFKEDDKTYLRGIMHEHMALIQSTISELKKKRAGMEKQADLVQSDYKRYLDNPTMEHYTALTQDLSTLKEYSNLPPSAHG